MSSPAQALIKNGKNNDAEVVSDEVLLDVSIEILRQSSGPSALEVSYCQKVRQRVRPVGVSAVQAYTILCVFNYALKGFSLANQIKALAIGAGIYTLTNPVKDALGTGQWQSIEDTAKEILACLFTPYGVVLGGGYVYDNFGPKPLVENSIIGMSFKDRLGPFGQELGSKVTFVTLLWSLKVLLFKVTGLEKLSYHAKGFGWLQMIAEQTQVWPIQLAFIAIASAFHAAGFNDENSLFDTAAIVIAIFHVMALLGLKDGLVACFSKCCSAKQPGRDEYFVLDGDEEKSVDYDLFENGMPKETKGKGKQANSIFAGVGTKKEDDERKSLMKGKLGGSYGARGSQ